MSAPRSAPWRRGLFMSETPYIVAAYIVTWAVVLGYVGYAHMRHAQARRRYEAEAENGGAT